MDAALFIAALILTLPVTVSVAFIAFAIGRRQFSLLGLVFFIACVATAIWLALWVPEAILRRYDA